MATRHSSLISKRCRYTYGICPCTTININLSKANYITIWVKDGVRLYHINQTESKFTLVYHFAIGNHKFNPETVISCSDGKLYACDGFGDLCIFDIKKQKFIKYIHSNQLIFPCVSSNAARWDAENTCHLFFVEHSKQLHLIHDTKHWIFNFKTYKFELFCTVPFHGARNVVYIKKSNKFMAFNRYDEILYFDLDDTENDQLFDILPNTKYKTELCKYWRNGRCAFGAKRCKYAHGHENVRSNKHWHVLKNIRTPYIGLNSWKSDLRDIDFYWTTVVVCFDSIVLFYNRKLFYGIYGPWIFDTLSNEWFEPSRVENELRQVPIVYNDKAYHGSTDKFSKLLLCDYLPVRLKKFYERQSILLVFGFAEDCEKKCELFQTVSFYVTKLISSYYPIFL
eukprot:260619_1